MAEATLTPPALDFTPAQRRHSGDVLTRPSLSYWQDAWRRLKANPRAIGSLYVVLLLIAFAVAGPWVWNVDPAAQDLDQISQPPSFATTAVVVAPYTPWSGVHADTDGLAAGATDADLPAPNGLQFVGEPTTQTVRLQWSPVPGASNYRVYRNRFEPRNRNELGVPVGETMTARELSFEDRLDLQAVRYYYAVVASADGFTESIHYSVIATELPRVVTIQEATERGLINSSSQVTVGDVLTLRSHPFGTDYLGRDMLARLMHGARISLFIGIVAPFLFVTLGVLYGAIAGFLGGWVDAVLMRFADFVVALPFLLFMILIRIAFGVQSGESGIAPLLIALIVLSWPATARLVRGQILQIREEGYVQAARLMGAPTRYLLLRHMIPNTIGVVLVTLTFAVPSAIFTEAFLSFIGMGVAPPTPSWGSMSNEGLKTMLTTPHELIAPSILISITVLAFNLLGDGLRDALDARMRSRE